MGIGLDETLEGCLSVNHMQVAAGFLGFVSDIRASAPASHRPGT